EAVSSYPRAVRGAVEKPANCGTLPQKVSTTPRVPSVPSYRLHKPSGQAVVTIRHAGGVRRDVYLGESDSPGSCREYVRIAAELAVNPACRPRRLPATPVRGSSANDFTRRANLAGALLEDAPAWLGRVARRSTRAGFAPKA